MQNNYAREIAFNSARETKARRLIFATIANINLPTQYRHIHTANIMLNTFSDSKGMVLGDASRKSGYN